MFAGQPCGQINLVHGFADNGLVTVTNDEGDSLTLQIPAVESLTQVGNIVSYICKGNIVGATVKATVSFDFDAVNKVKITIAGTSSKATSLAILLNGNRAHRYDTILKRFIQETIDPRTNTPISGVAFDWSDVTGITSSFSASNNQLTFNIGTTFSVDPATVSTSTSSWAKGTPDERQVFYANGRHWVFFNDGTNLVYSSSVDGVTSWAANVSCGAVAVYLYSIYWDGTYVHYARQGALHSQHYDVFYRRGIPVSDGTITWSAAEQTVKAGIDGDSWFTANVYCDSEGHAWISSLQLNALGTLAIVCKNNNTDGTWSNAAGFPYALTATSSLNWNCIMAVLTAGKMYAFYAISGGVLRGRLYDGANWGAEENTFGTYNVEDGWRTTITSYRDDVIVGYCRDTTNQFRSIYRLYGTGWGTEVLVQDSVTAACLSADSNGRIYCFWTQTPTDNHVYYKIRTPGSAGAWDADPTDWTTETNITQPYNMSSFYNASSNIIGVSWMTSDASPYNVRYAFVYTPQPFRSYYPHILAH